MSVPQSIQDGVYPCAHCGEQASLVCSGCLKSLDAERAEAKPTRYCSSNCQKKDWSSHKASCKESQARKILYRAADTAQALFYVWREIVFDISIAKVEKSSKQIVLYEGHYGETDCFIPFPAALISDENDKKAILAYSARGDAYAYMDVVLRLMLNGISCELRDVPVQIAIDSQPLKMRLFRENGQEDLSSLYHEALQVTLKRGEVFIVDLTGVQYGHYKPVSPLKSYLELRAESASEGHPFGFQRSKMVRACEGDLTWPVIIRKNMEQVYKRFNAAIMEWTDNEMQISTMLRLKEELYLDTCKRLMEFVQDSVTSWKNRAEEGLRTTSRLLEHDPIRIHGLQEPDHKGVKDQKQTRVKKQRGKKHSEAKKKKSEDALARADVLVTNDSDLVEPAELKGYKVLDLRDMTLEDHIGS